MCLFDDGEWENTLKFTRDNGVEPNFGIFFIDTNNSIIHVVFYEEYPNVESVYHNIDEMKNDKGFGIGDDAVNVLKMVIINIKDGGDIPQ